MRSCGNSNVQSTLGTRLLRVTGGYHMTHSEVKHGNAGAVDRLTTDVTGNTSLQTQYYNLT